MGELCDLFIYPFLSKPKACEYIYIYIYIWLFESYELKVGMLARITHGFCLVGWLVQNLHENLMDDQNEVGIV